MRRTGWDRQTAREIQTLYREGAVGQWPDARLVEWFARDRSERAFAALVDRHGPVVLRVCRAVAGNAHTAEDAFQAVFLVLARKAGSLRLRDGLGPWLHTVAVRVATNARHAESRRKRREELAAQRERVEDRCSDPDLARVLHTEIDRLPTRLRTVVLLCDVEGLGYRDAAQRLGCPVGTVKSRHSRGRARLRVGLARRGLAPAALIAATVTETLSAVVPGALRSRTVHRALTLASGGPGDGMIPALIDLLLKGTKTMMSKATVVKPSLILGGAILGVGATLAAVFAQGPGSSFESTRPTAATSSGPDAGTSLAPASAAPTGPASGRTASNGEPAQFVDEPPSDDEVWDALVKKKFTDARISVSKIREDFDSPKVYPLVGKCKQIRVQYECTIDYTSDPKSRRRAREVVYIDKTYLRPVPATDGSPFASPEPSRPASHPARPADQEHRLRAVEEKLERILKALEAGQNQPGSGTRR